MGNCPPETGVWTPRTDLSDEVMTENWQNKYSNIFAFINTHYINTKLCIDAFDAINLIISFFALTVYAWKSLKDSCRRSGPLPYWLWWPSLTIHSCFKGSVLLGRLITRKKLLPSSSPIFIPGILDFAKIWSKNIFSSNLAPITIVDHLYFHLKPNALWIMKNLLLTILCIMCLTNEFMIHFYFLNTKLDHYQQIKSPITDLIHFGQSSKTFGYQ